MASRPSIVVDTDEGRVAREVLSVLPSIPNIYQRIGQIVQVAHDASEELKGLIRLPYGARIRTVKRPVFRRYLTDYCEFLKWPKKGKPVSTHPPAWLVDSVFEDGDWKGLPYLEALVPSPMMVKGGRILEKPGYDPYSGLLSVYPPNFDMQPIPENPTSRQIKAAFEEMNDWLFDFMFEQPEHKGACFSVVLTYFARFMIRNGVPLFLVDANVAGAGKGKLIDAIGLACLGRSMEFSTQPEDLAEQKAILKNMAFNGALMVKIDNIDRPFGNGVFDAALTSGVWDDRPLFTDDRLSRALYCIWVANGNNIQFKQGCDTPSRTIHIRLDVPMERPQERTGFKHKDILAHTMRIRPRLAHAALTLLRGYVQAGYPDQGLREWSRFPEWSRLIRHCLVWAGAADPYLGNEQLVRTSDLTHDQVGDLFEGWQTLCGQVQQPGLTVREALAELERELEEKQRSSLLYKPRNEMLLAAVLALAHSKNGRLPDAERLGYVLRKYRRTVMRGRRLVRLGERTECGVRWAVEEAAG